jgi:hypothetical protein
MPCGCEPIYRQQESVDGYATGMFGVSAQDIEHVNDERLGRVHCSPCTRPALLVQASSSASCAGPWPARASRNCSSTPSSAMAR